MADWGGHSDPSEPRLPRRLADDLARLYEAPAAVPPEVDAQLAELGGTHCREVRVRRQIRFWGWVGAVVAILCVAVWAYRLWERPPPKPPPAGSRPAVILTRDAVAREAAGLVSKLNPELLLSALPQGEEGLRVSVQLARRPGLRGRNRSGCSASIWRRRSASRRQSYPHSAAIFARA